jgi:hypothetical protein
MTLIASFELDGAPILVGDMLLTSPVSRSVEVSTPLVHDLGGIQRNHVVGISQKLVIVHPHLCVAWSGGICQTALNCKNAVVRAACCI